jgi:DeoR/GlpR family transcriptional regulator of sugar metabolism
MLPAERKREIVDTVLDRDGCSVAELSEMLDVSKATIRRDLSDLEDEGRIERSHGGALPVRTVASEQSVDPAVRTRLRQAGDESTAVAVLRTALAGDTASGPDKT